MATFDNPSYFTMACQSPVSAESDSPSMGTKPKRFESWFKRPFKTKVTSSTHDEHPDTDYRSKQTSPEPHHAEQEQQGVETPSNACGDFEDVVYYNFCSAKPEQQMQGPCAADDDVINDDVFSDTSTTVGGAGSVRNLHRRRHSLGSWFRSSLAAAVRKQNAVSTAYGLESGATDGRPSTSSERALLPSRAVSSSVHCVSYRSTRDVRTPETTPWASSNSNGGGGDS